MAKVGRRGKYEEWLTDEGLALITGWSRRGLSEEQIAHNMGVSVTTLWTYKRNYPQFLEAIKNGKEVADIAVENALFKRACGYRTREVSYKADNNGELLPVSAIEKDVPPDTTAQIYWLKNRRPDLWRDRWKTAENADSAGGGVVVLPEVVAEAQEAFDTAVSDAKRGSSTGTDTGGDSDG